MADDATQERPLILVVDDEAGMRALLVQIIEEAGWRAVTAEDGQQALERLRQQPPRVVLTDLKMPRLDGMALLRRVVEDHPGLPVVVLTAFGTVPGAVDAMRLGAFDFLSKPLPDPEALRQVLGRALAAHGAAPLPRQGRDEPVFEDPAFEAVLDLARAVAPRDTTVLLTGESGVGKEVIARTLHRLSPRRVGPFVGLNCAALPESLLESELFGHEKGAFTGATQTRPGRFEQAQHGTLLLDEVAELQPALQAKFLRVLETRQVTRLGGRREIDVDARVIAATNRDLQLEVAQGRFREDLFFRLNVFPIPIPPLRERPADILPLAHHFLNVLAGPGRTPLRLTSAAEQALRVNRWPGNVRELQNTLERAVILAGSGTIEVEHLGPAAEGAAPSESEHAAVTLKEMERRAIADALRASSGNRRKAAKQLGIALRTLQYKIKEYDLS